MSKAIVAMSGGVDSSTTAYLLQKKGFQVEGLFMRVSDNYSREAESAAQAVCEKLKIKFHSVDVGDKFKKEVIDYFLDSYEYGLTPNPCVNCNQLIKFGELYNFAMAQGADYLATGHYIRLRNSYFFPDFRKIVRMMRADDSNKDQTYFLYNLTQKKLRHILFPLGKYQKPQIKKIAREVGLPHLSKESQDICFLSGDHNIFLREHLELTPGEIRTLNERVIGEHRGLPLYTIGQRRGIEIGGTGPYYVAKFDYDNNILYVVSNFDDPILFHESLTANNVNWIAGKQKMPLQCQALIRYGHNTVLCRVEDAGEGAATVHFRESQRAVTPGQSVVFYQGKELLGGGVIA